MFGRVVRAVDDSDDLAVVVPDGGVTEEVVNVIIYNEAMCTYDTDCTPFTFNEICSNGEITFCGPGGETTQSCTDIGFRGCTHDLFYSHCI